MPNHSGAHSAALARVVAVLRERGCWCTRIRGGLGQQPGLPDILGCLLGGQMLAVEVKTGKGRPTPAQAACHAALRDAGAVVLVGDLAHVLAELDTLLPPAQLSLIGSP